MPAFTRLLLHALAGATIAVVVLGLTGLPVLGFASSFVAGLTKEAFGWGRNDLDNVNWWNLTAMVVPGLEVWGAATLYAQHLL